MCVFCFLKKEVKFEERNLYFAKCRRFNLIQEFSDLTDRDETSYLLKYLIRFLQFFLSRIISSLGGWWHFCIIYLGSSSYRDILLEILKRNYLGSNLNSVTLDLDMFQVKLTVPNLPPLSDSHIYTCLFGDVETSASVNHDGLVCDKPEVSSLPTIQQPRGTSLLHCIQQTCVVLQI